MAIAGTWKLELNTPMGKQTPTLELGEDGSGKFESPMGSAELTDGAVNGDEFTAKVVLKVMGRDLPATVKGKVEGDSISGVVETGMGNSNYTGVRG